MFAYFGKLETFCTSAITTLWTVIKWANIGFFAPFSEEGNVSSQSIQGIVGLTLFSVSERSPIMVLIDIGGKILDGRSSSKCKGELCKYQSVWTSHKQYHDKTSVQWNLSCKSCKTNDDH